MNTGRTLEKEVKFIQEVGSSPGTVPLSSTPDKETCREGQRNSEGKSFKE